MPDTDETTHTPAGVLESDKYAWDEAPQSHIRVKVELFVIDRIDRGVRIGASEIVDAIAEKFSDFMADPDRYVRVQATENLNDHTLFASRLSCGCDHYVSKDYSEPEAFEIHNYCEEHN